MKKIIIAILSSILFANYCFALDILSEQDLLAYKPDKCPDIASVRINDIDSTGLKTLERKNNLMINKSSVLGALKTDNYGKNVAWQLAAFSKNEIFNYDIYGYAYTGFSLDNTAKLRTFMIDTLNSLQPTKYSTYYNTLRLEKPSSFSEDFRWVCHYLTKDPTNTQVDVYYPRYY